MFDNVAGYVYQGRTYCPEHIIPAIDGQAPVEDRNDVEPKLDYLAQMFGIDRHNEPDFRTMDFPKVVFAPEAQEKFWLRCYDPFCDERLCAE